MTDFTVRYEVGLETGEARLVDFDQLTQRFDAAGGLALARPADEEAQR